MQCICPSYLTVCSCSSSRIELGDVTPHNIKQLKRLNQVIFPVSYNDKFYKDVLEVGELAKLGNTHLSCSILLVHIRKCHRRNAFLWSLKDSHISGATEN